MVYCSFPCLKYITTLTVEGGFNNTLRFDNLSICFFKRVSRLYVLQSDLFSRWYLFVYCMFNRF